MARILVIYGTTDGQTAKIAAALGDGLRAHGTTADVHPASDDAPHPDRYDGVIVAASLHAGAYQRAVRRWLRTHAAALRGKTTGFVSVCLGVLQHDPAVDRELEAIRARLFLSTDWQPTQVLTAAGALRYTRYGWLKRWALRRMAQKAGGDTDTSRDYEYTDWTQVNDFAAGFAKTVIGATGVRRPADASAEVA